MKHTFLLRPEQSICTNKIFFDKLRQALTFMTTCSRWLIPKPRRSSRAPACSRIVNKRNSFSLFESNFLSVIYNRLSSQASARSQFLFKHRFLHWITDSHTIHPPMNEHPPLPPTGNDPTLFWHFVQCLSLKNSNKDVSDIFTITVLNHFLFNSSWRGLLSPPSQIKKFIFRFKAIFDKQPMLSL